MFPKYSIMVTKKGISTHFAGNTHTEYFTEAQKENGDMQSYVERKAKAGFVCVTYNMDAAYSHETSLVQL